MSHDEGHNKEPLRADSKHAGETAKSVLKEAAATGIVRSAIDPWLRKVAQRFGASVPAGSWLRSETGEHALGGIKQFAEEYSKHFGQPWSLLVETATDFLDMAGLYEGGKPDEKPQVSAVASTWISEFHKSAAQRLAKTPNHKLEETKTRLRAEWEFRKEIVKTIEDYVNTPAEEEAADGEPSGHDAPHKPEPIDWDEVRTKFEELLARSTAAVASGADFLEKFPFPAPPVRISMLIRLVVGGALLAIFLLSILLY